MGLFDSIFVICPQCGGRIEFQSKAGACQMSGFTSDRVPASIADDLNGSIRHCKYGHAVRLMIESPPRHVRMVEEYVAEQDKKEAAQAELDGLKRAGFTASMESFIVKFDGAFSKRPNVELTGAAPPYGAASAGTQGYASGGEE